MTTKEITTVPFDPGYARHTTILSISTEAVYNKEIDAIPRFSMRKIKFKMVLPKLVKMTNDNIGFCMGCLLWAAYLKTLDKNITITGNPCLGTDYDEKEAVEEIDYSIEFYNKLKKDANYYLGINYIINSAFIEILEIYKEFFILNEGFVNTKTIGDIKLPKKIIVPEKEVIQKIIDKINYVVKFGNLLTLVDVFQYVYKFENSLNLELDTDD